METSSHKVHFMSIYFFYCQ